MKTKGIVCRFHKQHTENIISVSLETGGYAILKREIDKNESKDWYLTLLRYKKYPWSKKITKVTVFNKPIQYLKGYFRFKHVIISRKAFTLYKKIIYTHGHEIDNGIIKKDYVMKIPNS